MAHELERPAGFLYEIGLLKRYKRTGWLVAGVNTPESIACRDQGSKNTQSWIDSSLAQLRTESAKRLAAKALTTDPLAWYAQVLGSKVASEDD